MGQPESKEMLAACGETAPMIQFALDLFAGDRFQIVVPTRSAKKNLIAFLQTFYPKVIIQLIEDSQEWPDTVLQTQPHWAAENILVLPDTRWKPESVVFDLLDVLKTKSFAYSTFDAEKKMDWGVVAQNPLSICDKPPQVLLQPPENFKSWGHLAFRKTVGRQIFSSILASHRSRQFEMLSEVSNCESLALQSFQDLTRPK